MIRATLALLLWLSASAVPSALAADAMERPQVRLTTDEGEILLELFAQKAPQTVANFLQYVDEGFYNGTIFHRVIPGFVVQGGGLTYDFTRKETREPVANESDNGLSNTPMTLAMARFSEPDSATSQFYINLSHNNSLDGTEEQPGYTVFGRVIGGHDTIVTIVEAPQGNYEEYPNAPNLPIRILTAQRVTGESTTDAN